MVLKELIKDFSVFLRGNESVLDRDYPHLAHKIELHWGYEEFYPFINSLLVNDNDRKREGFSLEAMEELYELSEIHERLFPRKNIISQPYKIK